MSWYGDRGYRNQREFSVPYTMRAPTTMKRFETDRQWNGYEHVDRPHGSRYNFPTPRLPYFLDYGNISQPRFYADQQRCAGQVPRFRGNSERFAVNSSNNSRCVTPSTARPAATTTGGKALPSTKSNTSTSTKDNALMKKAGQIIDDILSGGTGKDLVHTSPVKSTYTSVTSDTNCSTDVGASLLAQADSLRKQFGEKRAQLFKPRDNNNTSQQITSLIPPSKLSASRQQASTTTVTSTGALRRKSTTDNTTSTTTALSSGIHKAGQLQNLAHLLNSRSRKDKIAVAKLLDTYKQKLPARPKLSVTRALVSEEELLDIDLSDIPDDVKLEISELLEDAGLWSVLGVNRGHVTRPYTSSALHAATATDTTLETVSGVSVLDSLDTEPDSVVVSRALMKLNNTPLTAATHSTLTATATHPAFTTTHAESTSVSTTASPRARVYANAETKPIVFTVGDTPDVTGDSVLVTSLPPGTLSTPVRGLSTPGQVFTPTRDTPDILDHVCSPTKDLCGPPPLIYLPDDDYAPIVVRYYLM